MDVHRILLVDDHNLFREGLTRLINDEKDLDVVGAAGSVKEAIALATSLHPELVLMDYELPDGTGLDATTAILQIYPDISIVFLTMHSEDDQLFQAIRYGAKGYLVKGTSLVDFLTGLRGALRGEPALSPSMATRILAEFSRLQLKRGATHDAPTELLTSREDEVLDQIASGATNREIANKLKVTESTVKNHVHNILLKLHLVNRRAAAQYARRHRP